MFFEAVKSIRLFFRLSLVMRVQTNIFATLASLSLVFLIISVFCLFVCLSRAIFGKVLVRSLGVKDHICNCKGVHVQISSRKHGNGQVHGT